MNGDRFCLQSNYLKLLDPKLIKTRPMLKHMIRSFYPVWVGPVAFRVLRNGKLLDKDLFRAVLTGHIIDLKSTVSLENKLSEIQERESAERAKLDKEIREMLQERRRPVANLESAECSI